MRRTLGSRSNAILSPHFAALLPLLVVGIATVSVPRTAKADEVFNTDFSKGTFDTLGWTAKGDWSIVDLGADHPDIANNPGPVAKFPAHSKKAGLLSKTFPTLNNPANLKLTFDGGYGWGKATQSQALEIMLLDADGNGYVFDVHRYNATWGVQYAVVSQYGYNNPLTWAPAPVDTSQKAVMDGGGLRTFTITRDGQGNFTFDGDGWTGANPVKFQDTTTTSFSQVVLYGTPNIDDLLYNKIKLEAGK